MVAGLVIGGTAIAASSPGRRDDNPAVQASTSDTPAASPSADGHGGHGADDGPGHDLGDDRGGRR
ncbi:hypothetical protein Drose_10975 [Dactylosporangium roseum]|uniref:Uncharacterized protein n=1 Tax=Dactylosporangium roseum TaxID=47989 RepID=A0ABY5ZD38_9ACTN|nr:hypothetical protein [Dactylosporangium roseum]UWZ38697.1 hypothetical protein Drose_10975 [Dactylosporangium roseum]